MPLIGQLLMTICLCTLQRQLGPYTIMPLSSASPGVVIRPGIVDDYKESRPVNRASKLLTLGIDAYDTMRDGVNSFYCKGWNRHGRSKSMHFQINKIPYYDIWLYMPYWYRGWTDIDLIPYRKWRATTKEASVCDAVRSQVVARRIHTRMPVSFIQIRRRVTFQCCP